MPANHAMSTYRTSCGETLERLPLYVGGDLDPEALASVRAHLDACRSCAGRARAAQRAREDLANALRASGALEGGSEPSLWPGLRNRLRAEGLIRAAPHLQATPRSALTLRRKRLKWLAPLVAAAALIAVVQGTGLLRRAQPDEGAPRAPEVAAPEAPSAGTLRRIAPLDVEPLVPFQARRPTLGNGGWLSRPPVSTAGFPR